MRNICGQKINLLIGEKAEVYLLFGLTISKDGQLPIKMDTELNINFLGFKVSKLGDLIADDPSQFLDKKHQTKLSGIVGFNLIQLSYHALVEKYRMSWFDSSECSEGMNPLLFSNLCVYYYSDECKDHTLGV